MRIIKIEDDWVIFAKELDPINSLEAVFGLSDLAHMKKRVNQFLQSSFFLEPHITFKKEPSFTLFFVKLIQKVIISLYIIEDRKEEYKKLNGIFSTETIQRIYENTRKKGEMRWIAYPYTLTKKEIRRPLKLLTRIREVVELEDWLDFLDQCTHNCLAFGFEPEWEGFQNHNVCTYYLPKLFDVGFLIYASETQFGRKYVLNR